MARAVPIDALLQVEVALAYEQAKLLDILAGSGRSLPPNHDFIVLKELLP